MKLVVVKCFVSCATGLLSPKNTVTKRLFTKLRYIICIEVVEVQSFVNKSNWAIDMICMIPQYSTRSMICLQVFLAYLIISSIWIKFLIAKLALQTASAPAIPMPTSAYLIAMRSLAPSPTMPTLNPHYPKCFLRKGLFYFCYLQICLCFWTISALFSGVILANTLILSCKKLSLFKFMYSLSIAQNNRGSYLNSKLSKYSTFYEKFPSEFLTTFVISISFLFLHLLPYKMMNVVSGGIIPVSIAVWMPR